MRDAKYIEIPGNQTHELPPLLVHSAEMTAGASGELASVLSEAEDMLGAGDAVEEVLEQRKFDLALQLSEQYKRIMAHWFWGDDILEWIRQCEITFESEAVLRQLLHPDVWPHASRASFVTLLADKRIATRGVTLERAVGLRLMFREPSPIHYFSSQFLLYLYSSVADTAFQSWSQLELGLFPPERFHFDVLDIGEERALGDIGTSRSD
jgi:hypothetical protein